MKFSQGEIEEEPPFRITDGRDERTKAIDTEIRAWIAKRPAPEEKRPSELERKIGVRLNRKFGIMVCMRRLGVRSRSKRFPAKSVARPCGYLIIVENGEKLPKCPRCGARVWARRENLIHQHDDMRVIKRIIAGVRGWLGSGKPFVPMHMFGEWQRRAVEDFTFIDALPWNLVKS